MNAVLTESTFDTPAKPFPFTPFNPFDSFPRPFYMRSQTPIYSHSVSTPFTEKLRQNLQKKLQNTKPKKHVRFAPDPVCTISDASNSSNLFIPHVTSPLARYKPKSVTDKPTNPRSRSRQELPTPFTAPWIFRRIQTDSVEESLATLCCYGSTPFHAQSATLP